MNTKLATTSTPIMPVLQERWSPRAFDPNHTLTEDQLASAFEAARWAPSAGNTQPARFLAGLRGREGFTTILESLNVANARWAKNASALVVNATESHDDEGKDRRWAEYDLGQAVGHFTVQAHADGLFVHQMGGFDGERISTKFNLPEAHRVVSVMAVGLLTEVENVDLAEHHVAQEVAPRMRHSLETVVRFA